MYDKLRSEIQKRTDQHHTVLPKQIESVDDRFQRLVGDVCQSKADQDMGEAAESEPDDPDIIPPSVASGSGLCKVFNPMKTAVLIEKCRSIIRAGPIAQDRIKEALNGSKAGMEILRKFSLPQITNRLKYERKKHVLFAGSRLVGN